MTDEELQKIEDDLKEKNKRINELMEIRSKLLEIPEVKKFSETDEEYRKLEKETDIVSKKAYRRSKDFDIDSVIYKDMCFGKPKNIAIDFYHTGILYGKFINLGDNKSNEEEKSKMFVKIMKRKDVQERLNRTK